MLFRSKMRNMRRGNAPPAPIIATVENLSIATADTVVSTDLYAPPLSGSTSFIDSMRINVRSCEIVVSNGGTAARVYAVLRRVPQGYSSPSIAISTSTTTFVDPTNVMAYAIVNVNGVDDASVNLSPLRRSLVFNSGDKLVLQAVSDTSSTNQAFSALVLFTVDA